jgi:hypothetical protein
MDRKQAAASWPQSEHTAAERISATAAPHCTVHSPTLSATVTAASTQPAAITATTTLQAVAAHQTAGLQTTSKQSNKGVFSKGAA